MTQEERDDRHSNRIYWFIVGSCSFVLLYIAAITFIPIPKGNERFVDISLAFLMGTVLGGGVSYYVGASPSKGKAITNNITDSDIQQA